MGQIELPDPRWEALTPETQQAFHKIVGLEFIQSFYLAGGTGLALHLGHRFSVDLDFFSSQKEAVGVDQCAILRETFEDPSFSITFDKDATFVATWRGVGLSFFRLHLYPLVRPTLLVAGVRLASLEEIGAMKLAAIIDRGTRKDLVDLYFILQRASIESLFRVAAMKYARVRTFAISATRALAYFKDAEALPTTHDRPHALGYHEAISGASGVGSWAQAFGWFVGVRSQAKARQTRPCFSGQQSLFV